MWNDRALRAALVGVALAMVGCETQLHQAHYSPEYAVNLPKRNTPFPDACLEAAAQGSSQQLPPGCANALNLMRMVERPSELKIGAAPAPAMAAPVGRAVQRYLSPDEAIQRQRQEKLENEATTGAGSL
jgi:hypothetical protein